MEKCNLINYKKMEKQRPNITKDIMGKIEEKKGNLEIFDELAKQDEEATVYDERLTDQLKEFYLKDEKSVKEAFVSIYEGLQDSDKYICEQIAVDIFGKNVNFISNYTTGSSSGGEVANYTTGSLAGGTTVS